MSATLGVLEPWEHQWDGDTGTCRLSSESNLSYESLITASFFISVVSLGLGAAVSRRGQAPDIVKQRTLHRIMVYVLNAVITELPLALSMALSLKSFGPGSDFRVFAMCCQSCNGAFNAATFFGQSRYAAESIHQIGHKPDKQSFVVKFKDAPESDEEV
jgi:hypothetical protein